MSNKFSVTYNFKTLTAVMFLSLLEDRCTTPEEKQALQSHFEAIPDGETVNGDGTKSPKYKYKRKPVTVSLELPAELDALAAATTPVRLNLLTGAVTKVITEFVKSQYIDDFSEVGAHDLDTIAKVQAESGSRSVGFSFSDETLENAVKSFQSFLGQAIGNLDAAKTVATAAKSRFTRSSIQRAIGTYNEEVLKKLQTRVDQWGLWLDQNSAEEAEEFGPVHACWSATISKQLKQDAAVDISSIL